MGRSGWRWCARWAGFVFLVVGACHPPPSRVPTTGPQVRDLGRAAPTYLALAPRDVHARIGDTVRFTVARILAGQLVPCLPAWDATPPTVAQLVAPGVLVGQAPGRVTVRATCAPLTATTTVTVDQP